MQVEQETTAPATHAAPLDVGDRWDRSTLSDVTPIRFDDRGLVPVIVQDRTTHDVLMLGYADAEALEATRRTGLAHFHSRSRGRLWRKGETSGNVLLVRGARVDCDGDTVLLEVDPAGPTCHTGARSCFDTLEPGSDAPDPPGAAGAPAPEPPPDDARTQHQPPAEGAPLTLPSLEGFAWLEVLWATIRRRSIDRPAGSYTATLLEGGVNAAARKVVEEATEVLIAAKDDAFEGHTAASSAGAGEPARVRARLVEETADLLYHVLVLAAERGMNPGSVIDELRRRHSR